MSNNFMRSLKGVQVALLVAITALKRSTPTAIRPLAFLSSCVASCEPQDGPFHKNRHRRQQQRGHRQNNHPVNWGRASERGFSSELFSCGGLIDTLRIPSDAPQSLMGPVDRALFRFAFELLFNYRVVLLSWDHLITCNFFFPLRLFKVVHFVSGRRRSENILIVYLKTISIGQKKKAIYRTWRVTFHEIKKRWRLARPGHLRVCGRKNRILQFLSTTCLSFVVCSGLKI